MKKRDLSSSVAFARPSLSFVAPSLFALALCVGAPALAGERSAAVTVTPQQQQAMGIRTVPLQAGAAPVVLQLPARVTVPAAHEQIVSAPLAGLVVQLYVELNQPVKQGAPLLRIVSPELGPLQLQLMQAASKAGLARTAAQREQALYDEGIIAQRRVQEARAALAESEAALQQARAALRLAGMAEKTISRVAAGGRPEEGLTVIAAQAGLVTALEVKPGQRVDPATSLLHIARTDRLALEIQAPAAQAAAWRVGSRVALRGAGTGDSVGAGTVATITSISPVVSGASQTVTLRAEVAARGSGLRPGELVTVELALPGDSAAWDVPLAALAHEGKQAFVFVRTQAGFDARAVTVVGSAAQRVRIKGALKAGDAVAVAGLVALKAAWLDDKGGE